MENKELISLEEARYLREQLKPAFAGYLTDGNVSNRDVLATLMDLVSRNKIGIEFKSQKKPHKLKRIYSLGTFDDLLPFEQRFISTLFHIKDEWNAKEMQYILQSDKLKQIIIDNVKAIGLFEITKSRVVLKDDKGVQSSHLTVYDKATRKQKPVETIEDLLQYQEDLKNSIGTILSMVIFLLTILFVVVMIVDYGFDNISISVNPIIIFLTPPLLCLIWILWGIRKSIRAEGLIKMQFKDNVIPYAKTKYEDLFKFIKKYPLKKQRIYNEFMPHAIAFGLDTSWNETFKIEKETVIESAVDNNI